MVFTFKPYTWHDRFALGLLGDRIIEGARVGVRDRCHQIIRVNGRSIRVNEVGRRLCVRGQADPLEHSFVGWSIGWLSGWVARWVFGRLLDKIVGRLERWLGSVGHANPDPN